MQKYTKWMLLILAVVLISTPMAKTSAQASAFQLTSPGSSPLGVFTTQQIANTFGCSGGNVSPEFDWSGVPSGTQSFGLNIFDMDAATGSGFWHWVVFNIPASATSLPAGAGDPTKNSAPAGTIQAHNDGGMAGYVGPCPQPGDKPHRYVVTLFALKIDKIPLDATASAALVGFYLNGNALAKTSLIMLYGQPSSFKLTSDSVTKDSAFQNEQIANTFGCTGGNLSPALSWTGAPDGTKSYALTMYDVDAPTGSGLWHWVMFNLPASTTSLPAGAGDPTKKLIPDGTVQIKSDTGAVGYTGACPPQGDKPHRYLITLYALKIDKLPLDQTATGALVGFYTNPNALGTATLIVSYGH